MHSKERTDLGIAQETNQPPNQNWDVDTELEVLLTHIEDIGLFVDDGVIEISGIEFSVVNEDIISHSFEICSIVQGPLEVFTPSLDSSLACTSTEEIENNGKIVNQIIDFPRGIKVSDLVDISIVIQEL